MKITESVKAVGSYKAQYAPQTRRGDSVKQATVEKKQIFTARVLELWPVACILQMRTVLSLWQDI